MQHVTDSMQDTYATLVQWVVAHGDRVSPRGKLTYETLDFSLELRKPQHSLAVHTGRKLNPKIAAVEALQLIGGVCDPRQMLHASSAFSEFMDGGTFHGGYGQRTR